MRLTDLNLSRAPPHWGGSRGFEAKVEAPSALQSSAGPGRRHQLLLAGIENYPLYARVTQFPVAMSEGSHPFPSRTRKLSPPEPMVLRGKPRGRVGRCRIFFEGPESSQYVKTRGLRLCGLLLEDLPRGARRSGRPPLSRQTSRGGVDGSSGWNS